MLLLTKIKLPLSKDRWLHGSNVTVKCRSFMDNRQFPLKLCKEEKPRLDSSSFLWVAKISS